MVAAAFGDGRFQLLQGPGDQPGRRRRRSRGNVGNVVRRGARDRQDVPAGTLTRDTVEPRIDLGDVVSVVLAQAA